MFGAFFEEIANLFEELEVVLMPGEGEEDSFAPHPETDPWIL